MAITIDTRDPDGRGRLPGMAAPGTDDRARAFVAAQRHTRLVKVLRVGLPVGAVVVALSYLVTLTLSWKLGAGRLSVGAIEVTADDLTMKNPKYFGVTKDGGHYEVRAKKAIVEFNSQAPIKLIDVDGDLTQPNNVVTRLKAKHGLLDNARNQLELYDGIEIDGSNGLTARLSRATVYSKEHRIVSRHPVVAMTPTGQVKSQAMTIKTDTRQTSFRGNVEVRLVQTGGQAAGFGRDPRQPVDVRSHELDVDDLAKTAHFRGDVVATQGDSELKTPELQVEYEGKAADQFAGARPAAQSGGGSSRLKMLRATGGTVVTAGADRRVVSERADFDALSDTALFLDNVVVTQGKNVLKGRRLLVNRKTGKNRLDTPQTRTQPAGRIAATFHQDRPAAPAKPRSRAQAVQEGILGSFKTDPNAPMDIEADTLDTDDPAKTATFRGNVKAQQGEFVVRTVEMIAHYTGQSGFGIGSGRDETAAPSATGQLTRVDAKQKVLIVSKDGQNASGDWAIFDVKANTVLLGGRVIVTRGKDVAEGPRLLIDLTTGLYRFELDPDAPATGAVPAVSSSPLVTGPAAADATGRTCPPGKQCLLFYPKEARDRAKDAAKKLLPPGTPLPTPSELLQPGGNPILRGN